MRFDNGGDFHAGLHELVTHYKSDIARSDHENPFPRDYPVDVHKGLNGSCTVNTGKVIVWKRNEPFLGTGSHYRFFRVDVEEFFFPAHGGEGAVF